MGKTLNIFNIQRYSLHDGEGIRTVFFLKGCPLRCRWCCNPESQHTYPELMYRRQLCIGVKECGNCLRCEEISAQKKVIEQNQIAEEEIIEEQKKYTDQDIIRVDEDEKISLTSEKRGELLFLCETCPSGALHQVGKERSIEELIEIANKDAAFYGNDGGITISGGEPLMQENAILFLKRAKEEYFHTSIETCGCVPKERLLEASHYLDQIFMDVKSVDDEKHRLYTGQTGKQIRENLKALCENYPQEKITVRTPVIPGFNDSEAELEQIEKFLQQFPGITWQKLPYHTYGVGKYEMLGRKYQL